MNKTTKIIIASIVVVAVAVVLALSIYRTIRASNLNKTLSKILANDQQSAALALNTPGRGLNNENVSKRCRISISERKDVITKFYTIAPGVNSELKDSLFDFLILENDLVFAIRDLWSDKSDLYDAALGVETQLEGKKLSDSSPRYTLQDVKEYAEAELKSSNRVIDLYHRVVLKEINVLLLINKTGANLRPTVSKYEDINIDLATKVRDQAKNVLSKLE